MAQPQYPKVFAVLIDLVFSQQDLLHHGVQVREVENFYPLLFRKVDSNNMESKLYTRIKINK